MPQREIIDHHDGRGLTEAIRLVAVDEPGPGGANHHFVAEIEVLVRNERSTHVVADIRYQCGPRNEPGSQPGIVDGVLLAIVADRMKAFQAGLYACVENQEVLHRVLDALAMLKARADARAARGVLGTIKA